MDFVTPFIEWLLQCEYIQNNKLFLNAVDAKDNNIQIATQQVQKVQEYIDGSGMYKIVFTLFDYKSISFYPILKTIIDNNENVCDLLTAQKINDFVVEKENEQNYPNFGDNYEVQRIYPQYVTPSMPSIDNSLAKYSIPIICEVLAYEK